MISTFLRPYPNEIIYSWLFRYHVLNGNINSNQTFKEFFNKKIVNLNLLYPTYLDCLVSKLPDCWNITSDDLINNHTIFPFLKPFLSKERSRKALECMKMGNTSRLGYYMGIEAGEVLKRRIIKICPICDTENINRYGEAYLIRNHQLPGNYICTKHNKLLQEYIVPDHVKDTEFIHINDCILSECKNENLYKEVYDLSKDIDLIMKGILNDYNIELVKDKYHKKMKIEGYKSLNGRVDQKKLMKDFINYYSVELLDKLESTIDVSKSDYWLKLITQKSYSYPIHPIRYLLLIRFLFGGVKEFIDFDEEYKPFGEGPWICLNPVADHYYEPVINTCEIKKRYEGKGNHIILGTFRCKCGFEYTIRSPKDNWDEAYKNRRVIHFGHVWEEKLKELLFDRKYSLRKTARLMGTDKTTIKRHRDRITYSQIYLKTELNNNTNTLEVYKENIKKAIEENNKITRTEIRNQLSKEYLYLRKNDSEWLEQNLPKPIKYIPQNENWNKKDKELKEKVLSAIQEIIEEEGKPRKVSLTYIAKKVNYSGIRSKELEKLPLTKKVIEDNMESIEEYKKRCVSYIIEKMIENEEPLIFSNIASKINYQSIGYAKFKEIISSCLKDKGLSIA